MSALPMEALFEALANGLWRGSLLVIVAALLLRFVKQTTAAERYAVWLAVLAAVAVAPVAEALVSWARPAAPPVEIAWTAATASAPALPAPSGLAVDGPQRWRALAVQAGPFLWLWSLAALVLALRLVRRCWLAGNLKRTASPPDAQLTAALEQWESRLSARRMGATRVTERLDSPAAVGWIKPAVLLPSDAQQNADAHDLEMLWRHEQAHVARHDDWTQLWSEALFAVAWFHPAAYWIRRQLEKERELACDEAVVNSGVEAGRYAGALGRWAERAATNELPVGVMGLGRSRTLIIRRMEMLLSPSRILRRNGGRWAFVGSLAAALAGSILLSVSAPLVIRAQAVDIEVSVEQEVDAALTTPVKVRVPQVSVEQVIVSQAAPPTPAAPAAPPVRTAPRPVPVRPAAPGAPVAPVPPSRSADEREERARAMAERTKRWREEMQPHIEAIQREARRIQETMQATMGPQRERIKELAKTMAKEHAKSMKPLAKEMAELAAKMVVANALEREQLKIQMDSLAEQMKAREPEMRRLQEEMSNIEIDMRPFEEEMRKLEEGLHEKTRALEAAEKKFQKSIQQIP